MTDISDDTLIDAIYAATADPDAWGTVLKGFCAKAGAFTASITARIDRRAAVTVALPGARESAKEYSQYWCTQDPVIEAANRLPEGFIARARGLAPHFTETAFYNEHLRPFDRCDTLILNTYKRGTDRCQILIARDHAQGPYDEAIEKRFTVFRKHLVRATRIARRHDDVGLRQSLAAQALDQLAIGVILVRLDRPVFENRAATCLLDRNRGLTVRGGRLRTLDARMQERFDRTVLRAALERRAGELVLPDKTGQTPLLVTAVPLDGALEAAAQTHHPFLAPGAMITLLAPEMKADLPSAAQIKALAGLTDTEAVLVRSLMMGLSLEDAAKAGRMAVATARWHLKNVFAKTGTRRQGELLAWLVRVLPAWRTPSK